MDQVESEFWMTQIDQPLVCFRYIVDIFYQEHTIKNLVVNSARCLMHA